MQVARLDKYSASAGGSAIQEPFRPSSCTHGAPSRMGQRAAPLGKPRKVHTLGLNTGLRQTGMPRKAKPTAQRGVAPARQQGETKSAFARVCFCFSGRFSNAGLSPARPALPNPLQGVLEGHQINCWTRSFRGRWKRLARTLVTHHPAVDLMVLRNWPRSVRIIFAG